MTLGRKAMAGLAAAAVSACLPVLSQSAARDRPASNGLQIAAASSEAAAGPAGEVVGEIDDPHTGDQWALVRDPVHPAGPGRLVLVRGPEMGPGMGAERGHSSAGPRDPGRQPAEPAATATNRTPLRPVIRAGDALIVEERTAVVEARLQAVALGPAIKGAVFKARLKIGGKVVRAVAVAAGHAVFAPDEGAQP